MIETETALVPWIHRGACLSEIILHGINAAARGIGRHFRGTQPDIAKRYLAKSRLRNHVSGKYVANIRGGTGRAGAGGRRVVNWSHDAIAGPAREIAFVVCERGDSQILRAAAGWVAEFLIAGEKERLVALVIDLG